MYMLYLGCFRLYTERYKNPIKVPTNEKVHTRRTSVRLSVESPINASYI